MGYILMDTTISPPYSFGICIIRFPRFDPFENLHLPFSISHIFNIYRICHEPVTLILFTAPTTDMVRTGHHTRLNRFCDPDLIDEPADLGTNFKQMPCLNVQSISVICMYPDRIPMGDLC